MYFIYIRNKIVWKSSGDINSICILFLNKDVMAEVRIVSDVIERKIDGYGLAF